MLREGTCLTRHVCNNIYITIHTIHHSVTSRFCRQVSPRAWTLGRALKYSALAQQENFRSELIEREQGPELEVLTLWVFADVVQFEW